MNSNREATEKQQTCSRNAASLGQTNIRRIKKTNGEEKIENKTSHIRKTNERINTQVNQNKGPSDNKEKHILHGKGSQ